MRESKVHACANKTHVQMRASLRILMTSCVLLVDVALLCYFHHHCQCFHVLCCEVSKHKYETPTQLQKRYAELVAEHKSSKT
jgi:hypothetical protein